MHPVAFNMVNEPLNSVIIPTVTSVKAAIKHDESIGGTASIFVNEGGMQVVSPELAQKVLPELPRI
jgi:hypothetical protein